MFQSYANALCGKRDAPQRSPVLSVASAAGPRLRSRTPIRVHSPSPAAEPSWELSRRGASVLPSVHQWNGKAN